MKPIRILYVLDVLNVVGGTERQLQLLISHMDRARFSPSAITLYSTPMPHESEFGGLGCPTRNLGLRRMASVGTIGQVLRLGAEIRRSKIDIVHTFFPDAGIFGALAGKFGGAAVLIGRRDLGYWYTPKLLRVLRLMQPFVDGYLTNSEAVRRVVADAEAVPLHKVGVVRNGFFHTPAASARFRLQDFGFPDDAILVGTVANLRGVKRLDRFVEMAAGIRDRRACFLIVGYGEQHDQLVEQARRAGLGDRFRITHTISEVLDIVKLFDVGVLTSESEGLSNTLIEYGLSGVPSVAFDVGGNREVIEDGRTGFLVKAYDREAMRDAVARLVADAPLRKSLGSNACTAYADRFSGARMVEETQRIYTLLIAGRA